MKICVFQNGTRRPFCFYHNKNTFWDFNFWQLLICCYYDPNLQENTTKQLIAIFLGSCGILTTLLGPCCAELFIGKKCLLFVEMMRGGGAS